MSEAAERDLLMQVADDLSALATRGQKLAQPRTCDSSPALFGLAVFAVVKSTLLGSSAALLQARRAATCSLSAR